MESIPAPASARELVAAFLVGKSASSQRAYRDDLGLLRQFMRAASTAAALERVFGLSAGRATLKAVEFKTWLVRSGFSPSRCNRVLSAFRGITDVAVQRRLASSCPAVPNVRNHRFENCRSDARRGFDALLEAAESERNRAVLFLLLETGLSRTEISRLNVSDFDGAAGTVRVPRRVKPAALQADATAAIHSWIAIRGGAAGAEPLFIALNRRASRRLTPSGVGSVARAVAGRAVLKNDAIFRVIPLEESTFGVSLRVPLQTPTPEKTA